MPRKPKPFAKVVGPHAMPPTVGKYSAESRGAQWGVFDTREEAQRKVDELNAREAKQTLFHALLSRCQEYGFATEATDVLLLKAIESIVTDGTEGDPS